MAGTTFYFSGYDKGRGFDKYLISDKPPADPAALSFTATFFKDTDGKLKFRTENAKDPADPPRTYPVEMTYGGGLYKQRYLFRADGALFPFVQYNSAGNDAYADRTRKPWRDYHADWLFNEQTKKLANPPKKKSFDIECASCHLHGLHAHADGGGRLRGRSGQRPQRRGGHRRRRRPERAQHRLRGLPWPRLRAREVGEGEEGGHDRQSTQSCRPSARRSSATSATAGRRAI